MKVKLLKKIRQRFDWYIDENNHFILLDKEEYKVRDFSASFNVNPPKENWKAMKAHIFEEFGLRYMDYLYKKHLRKSKIKNRSL